MSTEPAVSRSPAERPRSNRLRRLTFGCAGCLTLPAMCLIGYLVWANRLPPPEPENVVLPNPNGFDACVAAADRLIPVPEKHPLGDASRADLSLIRPFLRRDRAALDQVRAAMRLPYVTPPIRSLDAFHPYLTKFRQAVRRFAGESRLALADGRAGEAIQRALDSHELASRVGTSGPLFHGLVSVALVSIGTRQAERCVERLSAEEARQAGQRLDALLPRFPTAAATFEEERKLELAALRRLFRGDYDLAELTGQRAPRQPVQRVLWFFYPKALAYRSLDRFMRKLGDESRKPYTQQRRVPPPAEPLSRSLAGVMPGALLVYARRDTHVRILRVELALQEHRARRGAYPQRLEELVPQSMSSVPVDPFTGKSFLYRRQGDRYLLYSTGPDGVDSGGQPIPSNRVEPGAQGDLVAGRLFIPAR